MIGYFASNDGTVTGEALKNSTSLMNATGRNLGNMAFWYTAKRLLNEEICYLAWQQTELPKNLKAVVIPAANFIGKHANLSLILNLVRKLDLPTLVVGLGAQSENEGEIPDVNPACREFLSEISKRAPLVAVRGEYSAKVCRALGVSNVTVLGCPSILMNPSQTLGETIERKMLELEDGPVAVHAACHKGNIVNVERELVRYVQLFPGSSYVVQRPPEMISAIFKEDLAEAAEAEFVKWAPFFGFQTPTQLKRFLTTHGYAPTSIDSWRAYLKRFTCSINTRIHGTIVSLQTELPSLCVVHDTRTKELCERMNVPYLNPQTFTETRYDIRRMFIATKFNGAAFDAERREIAESYVSLFKAMKLKPSSHLLSFTSSVAPDYRQQRKSA